MTQAELVSYLSEWDGRRTDYLVNLYEKHNEDSCFMGLGLEVFVNFGELERSASWILKHHIDQGGSLSEMDLQAVLLRVSDLVHWESQLHILQIVPKVDLTEYLAGAIEPIISQLLESERKFVRAAAFEAYSKVANYYPSIIPGFISKCQERLELESASVKVNLRRILKSYSC